MPDNSKDRTTIYLSPQSKADIQAILAAHPYLKSATAAIAYALNLAASSDKTQRQNR